ncbi:hypothetical protein TNCV_534821 [Trichonephila clavipes]|nr:hypothetical protein TNCV_534821 [Trichonephila clavipes]
MPNVPVIESKCDLADFLEFHLSQKRLIYTLVSLTTPPYGQLINRKRSKIIVLPIKSSPRRIRHSDPIHLRRIRRSIDESWDVLMAAKIYGCHSSWTCECVQ